MPYLYDRYEAAYANILPERIDGETFLKSHRDHKDPVTVIDPKRSYAVRAAARHPIYENFRVKVSFCTSFLAAGVTPFAIYKYVCKGCRFLHFIATYLLEVFYS